MIQSEAIKLLDIAPTGNIPSKVNPSLTQAQSVEIVKAAILDHNPDDCLNDLFEKRVWQVVKNQKRPRY